MRPRYYNMRKWNLSPSQLAGEEHKEEGRIGCVGGGGGFRVIASG